tara:strand:- start:239 stop:784 length:546 start_codon:yes stop_codon:yes gene_type:complete
MKKFFWIFLFVFLTNKGFASIKEKIIQNLENIDNVSFNFEQNINGKLETGKCTIQYPKKIFCKYKLGNQKILVSDGNSLVIKTTSSYYLYPLDKTPLNFILDKDFLLMKIKKVNQDFKDDNFIIYKFFENENEINIVFNTKTHNLVGWQTIDIYQNLSMTYLSSVIINQDIKKNLFYLPKK